MQAPDIPSSPERKNVDCYLHNLTRKYPFFSGCHDSNYSWQSWTDRSRKVTPENNKQCRRVLCDASSPPPPCALKATNPLVRHLPHRFSCPVASEVLRPKGPGAITIRFVPIEVSVWCQLWLQNETHFEQKWSYQQTWFPDGSRFFFVGNLSQPSPHSLCEIFSIFVIKHWDLTKR